jgi:hypothetical protein
MHPLTNDSVSNYVHSGNVSSDPIFYYTNSDASSLFDPENASRDTSSTDAIPILFNFNIARDISDENLHDYQPNGTLLFRFDINKSYLLNRLIIHFNSGNRRPTCTYTMYYTSANASIDYGFVSSYANLIENGTEFKQKFQSISSTNNPEDIYLDGVRQRILDFSTTTLSTDTPSLLTATIDTIQFTNAPNNRQIMKRTGETLTLTVTFGNKIMSSATPTFLLGDNNASYDTFDNRSYNVTFTNLTIPVGVNEVSLTITVTDEYGNTLNNEVVGNPFTIDDNPTLFGDPYIKPLHGKMYKLPDCEAYYRIIETPTIKINAHVQQISQEYINSEAKALNDMYFKDVSDSIYDWDSMYFFTKLCIIYNEEVAVYDMLLAQLVSSCPQWLNLETTQSTHDTVMYAHEPILSSTKLSIDKKLVFEAIRYKNPQVLTGISVKYHNEYVDGLCARAYSSESAKVSDMYSVQNCKFEVPSEQKYVSEVFYRNDGTQEEKQILVV